MRALFYTITLIIGFSLISTAVQAAPGTAVGEAIPHKLSLQDHTGKQRAFDNLKGDQGLALFFVRSVQWCPFCQKQLIDLGGRSKEFTDLGYNVVAISYDPVEKQDGFVKKNNLPFTLLSDQASEAIKAFGILNEAMQVGTFAYGVPHPGVFIVDADGKITHKFFESDYKQRPSIDTVLKELAPPPPPAPVKEEVVQEAPDVAVEPSVEEPAEEVKEEMLEAVESVPESVSEPVMENVEGNVPEATK